MYCLRVGSHVSFAVCRARLSCLILGAFSLSSVRRMLIVRLHRAWISSLECMWSGFWMTLSHLRTQMRWAASDNRICRRRRAPLALGFWVLITLPSRSSWGSSLGGEMVPLLRMVPRGSCLAEEKYCLGQRRRGSKSEWVQTQFPFMLAWFCVGGGVRGRHRKLVTGVRAVVGWQ
jgi:hypothetical protein